MNREIKFRGLALKGWVYGYYVLTSKSHHQILSGKWSNKTGSHYSVDVNPETVGQFTGIKNKNGIEIYENDIIIWDIDLIFTVVFEDGKFFGKPHPDNHISGILNSYHFSKSEILGNMHQNKELLNQN